MNLTQAISIAAIGAMTLYGCGNRTGDGHSAEHDTHAHHDHDHDHDHSEHLHPAGSVAIELDGGEKWAVNEEMKPYVTGGIDLVERYTSEGQTDYQGLATNLKAQNDQLIKSCTMTGKGHDELHKWLHPHLEIVYQLENASDAGQADALVARLQDSYQVYGEYFQ